MSEFDARIKKEIAERCARYDRFIMLAREITAHLGSEWTCREAEIRPGEDYTNSYRSQAYISRADGCEFYMSFDIHHASHTRIVIRGLFDFGDRSLGLSLPRNKSTPEISVGASRPAKTIAAEITRRFLPEHLALHAEVVAMVEQYTTYRDNKRGIVQRLAKLAGAKLECCGDHGFSTYHQTLPYVECTVYSDVTLRIENLNEAQAAAILTFVSALPAQKGNTNNA